MSRVFTMSALTLQSCVCPLAPTTPVSGCLVSRSRAVADLRQSPGHVDRVGPVDGNRQHELSRFDLGSDPLQGGVVDRVGPRQVHDVRPDRLEGGEDPIRIGGERQRHHPNVGERRDDGAGRVGIDGVPGGYALVENDPNRVGPQAIDLGGIFRRRDPVDLHEHELDHRASATGSSVRVDVPVAR